MPYAQTLKVCGTAAEADPADPATAAPAGSVTAPAVTAAFFTFDMANNLLSFLRMPQGEAYPMEVAESRKKNPVVTTWL
ncbi:hypothetical protein ACFV2H_45825 [Streptomyces sp. NPDC059629]|uniref:hypothetical protein n=1 Tax=Streptomyces sp. NPDC059629 TaxID=3346889 RepID=UPI0036CD6E31